MRVQARPYVAIVFAMCALLALIGAFIVFMRMQEASADIQRLRTQGHVSRAVVAGKKNDTLLRTDRSGIRMPSIGTRTTSSPINVLTIRFEPRSTVTFADKGTKMQDSALPAAPPVTGNFMADGQHIGVMWVSDELFAATRVGDMLIVVNTPFNRGAPKLVSEVLAYDETKAYRWIGGFLLLAVILGLTGRVTARQAVGA